MRRRAAATHDGSGTLELFADCAPMNAQLGSDLAQGPALGVEVGCTLIVHGRYRNQSQEDRLSIEIAGCVYLIVIWGVSTLIA
jgi:hypothetical protein